MKWVNKKFKSHDDFFFSYSNVLKFFQYQGNSFLTTGKIGKLTQMIFTLIS